MELLGLILALIGVVALIASAIILIIAVVKNTDAKLVSGLMLLTSFVLVAVGGIAMQLADDGKQSTPSPEKSKQGVVVEEEVKGTYENDVKPKLDELIERLDYIWTENWQVPFEKMSNLEMTLPELAKHLATLDQSYSGLLNEVEDVDLKAIEILGEEESSKIQEITLHLRSVIVQRSTVAAGLVEPLKNGTVTESDFQSALEAIELSNDDILLFSSLKAGFELDS